ncbi:hypothetical protein F4802DRAFT_437785 [Xylaria palmicola]|nr:hypothetical protein F4802DRAFT_437785 [Xylaria palmicola]
MTTPTFLSPALPSELLSYILDHHVYPTTLIICSSRAEFLASLVQDVRDHQHIITADPDRREPYEGESPHQDPATANTGVKHALLSSPLYQVAASRHIRVIYAPAVTHLRAHLSVFSPGESRIPAPPRAAVTARGSPCIILYGFLKQHRDTSEWSAQGLGNTASILVDVAHRLSWRALLIEPRDGLSGTALGDLLQETVPVLNGGARRLGPDSEGAWTGRTVEIGRILGRWFQFQTAQWDMSDSHD